MVRFHGLVRNRKENERESSDRASRVVGVSVPGRLGAAIRERVRARVVTSSFLTCKNELFP